MMDPNAAPGTRVVFMSPRGGGAAEPFVGQVCTVVRTLVTRGKHNTPFYDVEVAEFPGILFDAAQFDAVRREAFDAGARDLWCLIHQAWCDQHPVANERAAAVIYYLVHVHPTFPVLLDNVSLQEAFLTIGCPACYVGEGVLDTITREV